MILYENYSIEIDMIDGYAIEIYNNNKTNN
jgi:hypothetical protein